jgi:hypothetical protein
VAFFGIAAIFVPMTSFLPAYCLFSFAQRRHEAFSTLPRSLFENSLSRSHYREKLLEYILA